MIVVAIVGILAAIAIPAYNDFIKRSRMSEVTAACDAIAQSAVEYHSHAGHFPFASYGANNLASFSTTYINVTLAPAVGNYTHVNIILNFKSTLDLIKAGVGEGELQMNLDYDSNEGYYKIWASSSTIDPIYMPKK